MEEKLNKLYKECVEELNNIGIDVKNFGEIQVALAKRKNKRYGCCKQENPDESSKYIERHGYRRIIKYTKFNKHYIEISKWVMDLENEIIKNTIMHEIIHCIPFCNNHGSEFKKYSKYINKELGYNISTRGNKQEDCNKSNVQYEEVEEYKYKIECEKCGQTTYRKRHNKNFTRKYRCGKCGGKFKIIELPKGTEVFGNF